MQMKKNADWSVSVQYIIYTCFKAALAWVVCADSAAAALWGVERVAGTEGRTCAGWDEESGPADTHENLTKMWETFLRKQTCM